jgi:hypothetical protein
MMPSEHQAQAGSAASENGRSKNRPVPPFTCGRRLQRALRQPKALSALFPVQRKRRTFASGQALKCLHRKLNKPAARVRKLNQICAWVEKPPSVPHLRIGPLLGSCMNDLVSMRRPRSEAETSVQPSTSAPRALLEGIQQPSVETIRHQHRLPRPKPWAFSHHDFTRRQAGFIPRPLPGPLMLSLHVSNEFLQRFGTTISNQLARNAIAHQRWNTSFYSHNKSRHSFTEERDKGQVTSQYAARIARRFARTLNHSEKHRSERNGFSEMSFGFSISSSWAQASLSASLTGPSTNLDVLIYWARRENAIGITTNEVAVPLTHKPVSTPAVPTKTIPGPTAFSPRTLAGLDRGEPLVAPPLAAEVPATLQAPRTLFEAPTPYASATLRHEARQDETDLVQEDLDLLADKIKRILDEEARRHGIQV